MQKRCVDGDVERAVRTFLDGRDRQASFHVLVDHYYLKVRRFFSRRGLHAEDCLDLTQQTFLVLYQALPGLEDPTRFCFYLFAIARNVLNRWGSREARKRQPEQGMGSGTELEGVLSLHSPPDTIGVFLSPSESAETHEIARHVRAAVSRLPERQRACMELHLKRFKNNEIGSSLGITQGAVGAHLFQARKNLRQELTAFWVSP